MPAAIVSEVLTPWLGLQEDLRQEASTRRRYAEMAETISSVFPALDRAVLVAALARY